MKANTSKNRLGDFQVDIENLFDQLFGGHVKNAAASAAATAAATVNGIFPRTDITESDSQYVLVMELPGVAATDVSIEMKEGCLDISGSKSVAQPGEGDRQLKQERRSGEFHRQFDFSTQVDSDKISADFKNGLLTIVLPKSEKSLPRKIEITTSEA